VVAAVVVLLPHIWEVAGIGEVHDSKKLSDARRRKLVAVLTDVSHQPSPPLIWRVAQASVAEIDTLNIRQANFLAMKRAIAALPVAPKTIVLDGTGGLELCIPVIPLIQGDQKSLSIAVASLFAKVTRDDLMVQLHQDYPLYGWASNKGYGTADHHHALKCYGPTPHHRTSYRPVQAVLSGRPER
jgi:ribonuclease HII